MPETAVAEKPAEQYTPPPADTSFDDAIDALPGSDESRPAQTPIEPAESKPEEKTGEVKTPEEKPAPKEAEEDPDLADLQKLSAKPKEEIPSTPKALREQYEKTRKELDETRSKLQEFEKGIESHRSRVAADVESKSKTQIDAYEKRIADYEQRIQALDYTQSEEFNSSFQKPLVAAWQSAAEAIDGIKLQAADGTERDFTTSDLSAFVNMSDRDAYRAAESMGADGKLLLDKRLEIRRAERSRSEAIEQRKAKAAEIARAEADRRVETVKHWEAGISKAEESFPELFSVPADDKELADLHQRGKTLVRMGMLGSGLENLDADRRSARMLSVQSQIAARAAAFGPMAARLNRATAKIATLEKELSGFKKSEPGVGKKEGIPEPSARELTFEEAIDALPGVDNL